ncbi:hypothetical protein AB1Y20_002073 [Prymnesium parvum]|uniref:Uncharacterized protein n=1 Tax=Prymnesium parvum TaxID=97485 RepID=A0AB34JA31_PRYPA
MTYYPLVVPAKVAPIARRFVERAMGTYFDLGWAKMTGAASHGDLLGKILQLFHPELIHVVSCHGPPDSTKQANESDECAHRVMNVEHVKHPLQTSWSRQLHHQLGPKYHDVQYASAYAGSLLNASRDFVQRVGPLPKALFAYESQWRNESLRKSIEKSWLERQNEDVGLCGVPNSSRSYTPASSEDETLVTKQVEGEPQLNTQAYAFLWYGNTSSRMFSGAKVLVRSIRHFDSSRAIVMMSPEYPEPSDAMKDEQLRLLHERFKVSIRNPSAIMGMKVTGGCRT